MSQNAYKIKKRYFPNYSKAIQKPYQRPMMMVPRPVMGGNYNSNKPADFFSSSAEVKALDITLFVNPLNTPGNITPLNLVAPGSSFYQRVGRKIEMKSVRIIGYVNLRVPLIMQTNYTAYLARVMIVYDRQTNGALPAMSDILQNVDYTGVGLTTSLSSINLNNRDRFSIIRDQIIYMPFVRSNNATPDPYVDYIVPTADPVTPTYNIDMYCKLKGLATQYKADSAVPTIGDVATGALYLVTLGAYATSAWQINTTSRLRYLDRS